MDNIKNFEDFLDRMQGLLDNAKKQGHIIVRIEDLENAFPELRESEDERIRKAISQCVEDMRGQFEKLYKVHHKDAIAWLDKQCEQKPADKVEPKFHEGDWVVKGDVIAQILDVQEQYYVGLDTEGKDFTASRFLSNDKIYLWTIQDAKDGDVLACESGWTCIFKTLVNDETFSSYCFMDNTKWFCETGSECHTLKEEFVKAYNGKIYPATKEQRDLLLQKMKEAGYEWDAEKKELKEIEQKHADSKQETKPNGGIVGADFNGGDGYYKVNLAYLSKSQVELIENLVASWQNHTNNTDEWSEEDEQYLLVCKNALRKYQVTDKWDSNIISQWLDNKLKSIKPQNHWRPSKEQMGVIEAVINNRSFQRRHLDSLYEQLKKLSEE